MKLINEWAAKVCKVVLSTEHYDDGKPLWKFGHQSKWKLYEWDIADPRCRQIVREHFEIELVLKNFSDKLNWCAYTNKRPYLGFADFGKTIAEAEIACITKIHEAGL